MFLKISIFSNAYNRNMFHGASNLFGSLIFVTETIHVYSFINIMNTKFR